MLARTLDAHPEARCQDRPEEALRGIASSIGGREMDREALAHHIHELIDAYRDNDWEKVISAASDIETIAGKLKQDEENGASG